MGEGCTRNNLLKSSVFNLELKRSSDYKGRLKNMSQEPDNMLLIMTISDTYWTQGRCRLNQLDDLHAGAINRKLNHMNRILVCLGTAEAAVSVCFEIWGLLVRG